MHYPVSTGRRFNVVTTLFGRQQRRNDVVCLLGITRLVVYRENMEKLSNYLRAWIKVYIIEPFKKRTYKRLSMKYRELSIF